MHDKLKGPEKNIVSTKRTPLQIKARKELNEVEEDVPKFLEQLRNLLKEEDSSLRLPEDDKFLLRFLRARKFDVRKAKCLVKNYYEMRLQNKDLFENLYPESVTHVLDKNIQSVLEKRDGNGREIFIFRAGKWNPDEVNLDDIFRTNYLFLEEMTSSTETQISGVVAIVDFKGLGFYKARQFTPKHAIRMVQIIQNSFPCRFQEFHLINQPFIFNFLFAVVKPFLNEKIKNRIYFHGQDLHELFQMVDPEILPDYLGGSTFHDTRVFNRKLLSKNKHYKELLQYGYQDDDNN